MIPADNSLMRSGAHGCKTRKRPGRTPRPSRRSESAARRRRAQGGRTQKRLGRRRGQVEGHPPGSQSFPLYRVARARPHRPAIPARGAGPVLARPQREPRRAGARYAHRDAQAPDRRIGRPLSGAGVGAGGRRGAGGGSRPAVRQTAKRRPARPGDGDPADGSGDGARIRQQSGERRHGLRAHQLRPRRRRSVGANGRDMCATPPRGSSVRAGC